MIKTNWDSYIKQIRKREIDIIQPFLINGFDNGLEIGAGDGFQSMLLKKYVERLVATEYSERILKQGKTEGIEYRVCDAERIDEYFEKESFDFVFSSNVLEHLIEPQKALKGMYILLKDEGTMIHVLPNPFWKITQLGLFYPNLAVNIIERLASPGWVKRFYKRRIKGGESVFSVAIEENNNPKKQTGRASLLYPGVHGSSSDHIAELFAFSKKRWISEFERAGFSIRMVIKGPIASGYGFGFNLLRRYLEKAGMCSEYIYVLGKNQSYEK